MEHPTSRLSPKNQVSLGRHIHALGGAAEDGYVCGLKHRVRHLHNGQRFRVVVVMAEREREAREHRLRDNPDLSPEQAEAMILDMNGKMSRMKLDGQRRVVLPPHLVKYLKLDREVYMFANNDTVMLWNPQDWLRWSGDDEEDEDDDEGDGPAIIMV